MFGKKAQIIIKKQNRQTKHKQGIQSIQIWPWNTKKNLKNDQAFYFYRCFPLFSFLKHTHTQKQKTGKCRLCKAVCHQPTYYYCQMCAYQKGICAMCGKKILNTTNYAQTNV